MGGATARLRVTSLRQIVEMVAADEPRTAQHVLDNIERLRDRWATKNLGAKSDTAKTYASRAKTTTSVSYDPNVMRSVLRMTSMS